ncbi:MAG: biosynthetic-type acetolactate synthase large subunit [Calditrichaeota bacterium]|nr:MAG: biosynthetic-type acetolactate synthase large subunit [Calditrichota bacterium]
MFVTTAPTAEKNRINKAERTAAPVLTGAEIFIESLVKEGVDTIFGYPGGALIGLYDYLYKNNQLRHLLVTHEQGGAHAADGYARATGKPGVVLVTSGPGATNTVTGIATAFMDSIPLLVFTGQVPSNMIGNDAFQEADILGITRPITKHSFLVRDVADLADTIHKAFHIAVTGRPGPVLVDLPKDMLAAKTTYFPSKNIDLPGYKPTVKGSFRQVRNAAGLLQSAKKPVIYVGGGAILSNAAKEVTEFARKLNAPVTTTLLGLGIFPETDDLSLGMLGMHGTWYANKAVDDCDLLIAIGARFDDRVTGNLKKFSPHSKKMQIDIDPSCIGKNVPVDLPIVGDIKTVLAELNTCVESCDSSEWLQEIAQWKIEHPLRYREIEGSLKPQQVIEALSKATKGNAIIASDVGQHQMWVAQWYQFTQPRSHLSSGGLGTMGFGVPAALGAQVGKPDRTVIGIVGDGGFQMTSMEIATAVRYNIPVKYVILNNGYLGMVRQWQQIFFDKRYSNTHLNPTNPDFKKLAESYGAFSLRVKNIEELHDAFDKMLAIDDRPVVLDVWVSPEENVFPMIPANGSFADILEGNE